MDGDSRGGAALSVKAVSGKPIKFVGAGEKLEALEPFYPDRLAGRILGKPAGRVLHDLQGRSPLGTLKVKAHSTLDCTLSAQHSSLLSN